MSHADRNLLFGILAVQMNFVARDALIAAMHAWVLERSKPLGRILVEQQALSPARHSLLEQLVNEHLAAHDGDAEKSLAAVGGVGPIRDDLRRIADSELHATLDRFVAPRDTTARDPEATTTAGVVSAPAASSRFCILRPHAKGGLGQISIALDYELNREVALKELRPERADDPCSRARFLLEAEVTGRLEHPGVVPVYGLGCDGEGHPFYAMRLVKGESLKEAIEWFHGTDAGAGGPRRWNLELRRLLNRFVAVCNVVDYAHSRGVIHRDLKPANILLGPYGETLVVDWGLAKIVGRGESAASAGAAEATLQPSSGSSSSETLPGTALGTPAYMSPEQSEGRLEAIGQPSDVYSLGATLYCLLTGKPPLEGEVCEVLPRAQRGKFPPPRQVNRRVPRALEAVCLRAMALRPEDRFPSARALAGDIEHWLADEPTSAYRDSLATRLTRWGRRHKAKSMGIGALLAATVVALTIGTVLVGRERDRLDWQLYIDHVNRAYREWSDNNVALAEQLLEECPPARRNWEWRFVRRLGHLDEWTGRNAGPVHAVAISADGRTLASGGGTWFNEAVESGGELVLRDAATGQERIIRRGLVSNLVGLAFNPKGDRLASAGYRRQPGMQGSVGVAGELTLWDPTDGSVLSVRESGPGLGVQGVAFSPDGRYLAAGYSELNEGGGAGHVEIWETSRDDLTRVARLPDVPGVAAVAFSPDGRQIAAASPGLVHLWTGGPAGWSAGAVEARELRGHSGRVLDVAFRPDGRQLASAGVDRTVRLWNPDNGREVQCLFGHDSFARSVAYSPDGRWLISGSEDRSVRLWESETGRPETTFRGHTYFVSAVAFGPGGRIVSGGMDRTVKSWSLTGGHPLSFHEHSGWVSSLDFGPDGARILSGSGIFEPDMTIKIWDVTNGRVLLNYTRHQAAILLARFRPDGRQVVSFDQGSTVRVWDATDGHDVARPLVVSPDPHLIFTGVAIRPDGLEIAVGGLDGTIRLWDLKAEEATRTLPGHTGKVIGLAYSPDGRRLASSSALGGPSYDDVRPGGELKFWDARTGRESSTAKKGIGVFRYLVFSPDGHRLILSEGSPTPDPESAQVCDAATGREIFALGGHTGPVLQIAFSPDGSRIATASIDRTVKLWDAATGQEVLTLRGHTAGVLSVVFSPDGHRLASGGIDNAVRVWDARPLKPGEPVTLLDR
jgi:eukaryotic-like serine/threonine-protein kinase